MEGLAPLLVIAAYVAAVTVPPILLNRWLADDDGYGLNRIFAVDLDPPWPRGIQEEEPSRWQVERLSRGIADRPADAPGGLRRNRAAAGDASATLT